MTHDELVQRAEKWLNQIGCGVVFNDRFQAALSTGERPDAIGWRSGVSFVIECKATRSDFLADKRKRFRSDPGIGMGDWRIYLCLAELIQPDEVPPGWGLLWVAGKTIRRVHGVPRGNVSWASAKPFLGNREAEAAVMYSALRRLSLSGHLSDVYLPLSERRQKNDALSDDEG